MLNLNRYRDREAYYRYATVATTVLGRVGGRVLWHAQSAGHGDRRPQRRLRRGDRRLVPEHGRVRRPGDGPRHPRGARRSRRRARAGRADPLRRRPPSRSSTDPEPGGRRVLAAALDLRGRRPAALGRRAAASPGWGSAAGERLEVAAVRQAFATDALVRREPGELYALRHAMPLRRPAVDAGRGLGRAPRPDRPRASPPRRRGFPAAPTGRAGSPPTPAATCTWSSAAGRTG